MRWPWRRVEVDLQGRERLGVIRPVRRVESAPPSPATIPPRPSDAALSARVAR